MTIPSVDAQLSISRLPTGLVSLLQVHGNPTGEVTRSIAAVLGVREPGFGPVKGPRAFAIGPTEWMLVDFPLNELKRRAADGFGRLLWRITDLTGAFATLSVGGTQAAAVLLSDIGAPRIIESARPGQYARTRLGQVDVVLQCVEPSVFEVLLDRNLAVYMESWLNAQSRGAEESGKGLVVGLPRFAT